MRQIKKIVLLILSLILITNSFLSVMPVLANSECYASFSLDTNYLLLGKTYTADFTKYPEDLEVTWSSSDTSIVTVTQTGVITPVSLGAANISIYYYDDYYGEDVEQYITVLIVDSLGLESGNTYYIMNAGTGRLMASDSTDSTLYTDVVTLSDDWTARSKWEIFQSNDGYYSLYGFGGSSGIILKTFGTSVELETYEGVESEKFYIYRIENGIYAGLYYIRQGDYYVAQDSNNNVYLTTVMGTNTRWSFMNVEKGWADMYGFEYTGYNSYTKAPYFVSVMDSLGYNAYSRKNSGSLTAYDILRMYDDVFVYRGHGNTGLVAFFNAEGDATGYITSQIHNESNKIYSISRLNNNSLSSARCVLYLACSTGTETENTPNLVDTTFSKGAHFVLGTSATVYLQESDKFLDGFLRYAALGYSIDECIERGLQEAGKRIDLFPDTNGAYPIYYVGDVWQNLENS